MISRKMGEQKKKRACPKWRWCQKYNFGVVAVLAFNRGRTSAPVKTDEDDNFCVEKSGI